MKVFIQDAIPKDDPIPGAVIAIQTFGDFLGFNPHCHILVTDGCFYGDGGMFRVAPPLELKKLEAIPRSGEDGRLYIQGLPRTPIRGGRDNQELPGPEMAGRDVFAYPEPGRADGALLRILQQRLAGQTPK